MENNNINVKKIIKEAIENGLYECRGTSEINSDLLEKVLEELDNIIVVDRYIKGIVTRSICDAYYKFFQDNLDRARKYIIEETLKEINNSEYGSFQEISNKREYKIKLKLRKTVKDYVEAGIRDGYEEGTNMDEDVCKPQRFWPYMIEHIMKKLDLLIKDKLDEFIEVPYTNEELPK